MEKRPATKVLACHSTSFQVTMPLDIDTYFKNETWIQDSYWC